MRRLLPIYLFICKRLTPAILGRFAEADLHDIETFFTRGHFEYTIKQEIHAVDSTLAKACPRRVDRNALQIYRSV